MKSTEDKRYCQLNPGHFSVWTELTDIRTRPVSVTHFIGLSDGLLEGEYRLVRAPVDNKSTLVKLFVIEQRSAWGTITPMSSYIAKNSAVHQIFTSDDPTMELREKRNSASHLNSRSE